VIFLPQGPEAVLRVSKYQPFVGATGIDPERDLDQAAVDQRLRGWADYPQSVLPSEKLLAKITGLG
jgi:hypothetical protein